METEQRNSAPRRFRVVQKWVKSHYHDEEYSACGRKLYLWEMEGEVCDQVFPRAHIEPQLPLKYHQVGIVGLVAWGGTKKTNKS